MPRIGNKKALSERAQKSDKRQSQAYELRLLGQDVRQIRQACGYDSDAAVVAALAREQKRQSAVTALQLDDERRLDLARADVLLAAVMPNAKKGDATAQRAALDLLKYRADLLGLSAPIKGKVELTGEGGGPVALAAIVVPGVASVDAWRQAAKAHIDSK